MTTSFCIEGERKTCAKPVNALNRWQGDERFMQSLARGLLALEAVVGGSGKPVAPQEIAAKTGLSIQTVRRCLYTLNAIGYVRANRNGAVPGAALAELAGDYATASPLISACGPVLDELHAQLGMTVSVATFEGEEPTIVASCTTDSILRVELPVGSVMPVHCTASGKLYLASLGQSKLEKRLAEGLFEAFTPRTITDPGALRDEAEAAMRSGYAVADEELTLGLRGIAVPIVGTRGRIVAALTASVITSASHRKDIRARIVPALKIAAAQLGRHAV